MGARVFIFLLAIIVIVLPGPRVALAQKADGMVQRLIEGARREGQLDLMITSSQGEKGAQELLDAFKRRFGLGITTNADLSGQESQKFNQAIAETKGGIPPTFDLMQGEPPVTLNLFRARGIEEIPNWEVLLAQIAPEAYKVKERVSPGDLAGAGFLWATRTSGLFYNPKLISERELPRTWKQMGDPKYRGAFSMPPWTTITLMGLLKYEKKEWLEIVRSWGRNKPQTLNYSAGIERMLLGDLKFLEANDYYYFEHKAKDSKAPIALTYFDDFTPLREVMYVVRRGARHPNAAKLFALWAAGSEANAVFEKHAFQTNVTLGKGPVSQKVVKVLKERNIKPLSWFENTESSEKFRWLATKEGEEYSRTIAKAQRDGT